VRPAPIAIVGLAGTFAGSRDLGEYWRNLLAEVDGITDVPASHFAIDDYYDPDPRAPDKTYARRGGFLPERDFHPLEFGLPPNILELTDVAQLLALVVSARALADAGYGEVNPLARRTGVVLGASALGLVGPLSARLQYPVWQRVLRSRGVAERDVDAIVETMKKAYVEWREDAFPGYLSNVVAGRVANRLDLGGINCTVDAACASSLASVQLALHELRSGNCDLMLAGGVDANNTPMGFVSFSKTPAFTTHAHMRPLDAASDGMLVGEGVGVVALRRLEDAERDGQRIYAVIRGIGASSDGRWGSIYAPRQEGQELALRRAYLEAGVPPASVGLIEAHGTGTPTGDPTELAALHAVVGAADGEGAGAPRIALGSVKSQIGHTKVAAGVASLIKVALALHDKVLPPTINVATPHPAVRAPFYLSTHTRPWFAATARRAGVSAFGFGGTNFHVVLEEHGAAKPAGSRTRPTPYALFVHAAGTPALAAACARLADDLAADAGDAGARRFRALVETSKAEAIPADAARVGLLAATREEAAARLAEAAAALATGGAAPRGLHRRERAMDARGGLVVLFPGQGSQAVGMGAALCTSFPPVHDAFARMDAERARHGLAPITDVVYPPPASGPEAEEAQTRRLRATNQAQAAIGALELGLFALLRRAGCAPDFVAGHSLGELAALCASGVLTEDDYLALLVARGEAMAQPPPSGVDAGALLAIGGDAAMLEQFLRERPEVTIANRNSRTQLVVAGAREELTALKAELAALGVTATMLPVAGAFHSHRVAHAQAPFARALDGVRLAAPRIPTFANTTAAPYPAAEVEARRLLGEQLVHPVEFRRQIEAIHDAGGRIFVECGPGRALTGLVGNILADRPHLAVALDRGRGGGGDDDLTLRDAYVQLRVAGVELGDLDPWQALPEVAAKKRGMAVRISGAPYRSERTRLGFEEALARAQAQAPEGAEEPAGARAPHEALERAPEEAMVASEPRIEPKTTTPAADLTAQAHLRYLEHLSQSSTRCFELTQQLYALATSPTCSPAALAAFERAVTSFHDLQLMAQQVQAGFLHHHVEPPRRAIAPASDAAPAAIVAAPAPIVVAPAAIAAAPTPAPIAAAPVVAAVVTPAPARPANGSHAHGSHASGGNGLAKLADAGARYEVGAPPPRVTVASTAAPAPASRATTPPPSPPRATVPTTPPPSAPPATTPTAAARPAGSAHQADQIAAILLAVISETTGYPLDTLDVGMEVDADLGIDSLKRVEIMAALEGRLFKSLAGIDFSTFATKRTVSDIARYLAEVG